MGPLRGLKSEADIPYALIHQVVSLLRNLEPKSLGIIQMFAWNVLCVGWWHLMELTRKQPNFVFSNYDSQVDSNKIR